MQLSKRMTKVPGNRFFSKKLVLVECHFSTKQDHLRFVEQLAMPFDWLVSRVEGVLYFFRHGFRDFTHYDDAQAPSGLDRPAERSSSIS